MSRLAGWLWQVNDRWFRSLRLERCKWKVNSTRRKVIQRNRPGYQAILADSIKGRSMDYAQTLSYEKRARRVDLEHFLVQKKVSGRVSGWYDGYLDHGLTVTGFRTV